MNIDDIENFLNDYTADRDKVFAHILNSVAINQAMLESVLDNQAMIMKILDPDSDTSELRKDTNERVSHYLAQIQASLSSKF